MSFRTNKLMRKDTDTTSHTSKSRDKKIENSDSFKELEKFKKSLFGNTTRSGNIKKNNENNKNSQKFPKKSISFLKKKSFFGNKPPNDSIVVTQQDSKFQKNKTFVLPANKEKFLPKSKTEKISGETLLKNTTNSKTPEIQNLRSSLFQKAPASHVAKVSKRFSYNNPMAKSTMSSTLRDKFKKMDQ